MYADFDYLPLEPHDVFFEKYPEIDFFLGQLLTGNPAFEWMFSRKPNHTFIHYLMHNISEFDSAIKSGGPLKARSSYEAFFNETEVITMRDIGHRTMIVDKTLLSPISSHPWRDRHQDWYCVHMLWLEDDSPLCKTCTFQNFGGKYLLKCMSSIFFFGPKYTLSRKIKHL